MVGWEHKMFPWLEMIWEALHFIPFSWNTYQSLKSSEKSCSKETQYFNVNFILIVIFIIERLFFFFFLCFTYMSYYQGASTELIVRNAGMWD